MSTAASITLQPAAAASTLQPTCLHPEEQPKHQWLALLVAEPCLVAHQHLTTTHGMFSSAPQACLLPSNVSTKLACALAMHQALLGHECLNSHPGGERDLCQSIQSFSF